MLAETAQAEEATGFDPSGLGFSGENGPRNVDDIFSANGVSTENATTISDSGYGSDQASKLTEADLSNEEKIESLLLIFGSTFRNHTVKIILKNVDGDLDRAFDELINRQYLIDSGDLPTGVDGFYVSDDDDRRPRAKGKAGRVRGRNGKNKLSIDYSVVSPVDNEELEGAKGPVLLSSGGAPLTSTSRTPAKSRTVEPPTFSAALHAAPIPGFNRISTLQASATALHRQGPLARQGLVVYTERVRDEVRASAARSFHLAQELVERQSKHTPLQIDLHGVTVLDGVRIAKRRVQAWWDSLEGNNREIRAKREGFTVVTGVGRHSAGGVSRLRQAVGAALRNDGWKCDTLTGSFRVIGRV